MVNRIPYVENKRDDLNEHGGKKSDLFIKEFLAEHEKKYTAQQRKNYRHNPDAEYRISEYGSAYVYEIGDHRPL